MRLFEKIFPWFGNTAEPTTKKVNAMSKYTNPMIEAIRTAAPLDLSKAHALANSDLFAKADVSYRSIIAKAKSLGVDYVKAAPAAKAPRDQEPTKAHYLAEIRRALALPERSGDLTKAELVNVLANLG
tara:strand:+ start:40 stop:423 length:384 start_codon:yes stop_codon:yes gene_type:complete